MRGAKLKTSGSASGGLALVLAAALLAGPPAAVGGKTVGQVPARSTPSVRTGYVDTVAVVGKTVVIGGTFTRLANRKGHRKVLKRRYLAAFDRRTGRVIRAFRPRLNGAVTSVLKVPGKSQVLVGGYFSRVNGRRTGHVVRLRVRSGKRVKRFHAPRLDGPVRDMAVARGRLYVGGQFKRVGGKRQRGLVALRVRNGHRTRHIPFGVAGTLGGIHNDPKGKTGVLALDVDRNGRHLVIAGNFSRVGKSRRAQLAQIRLGKRARVMKWATRRYRARCGRAFDTYLRAVRYAPNGRTFVVAATGGGRDRTSLCDAVAQFRSRGKNSRQQPRWVNKTGGDTLLSVAVSRDAVYVGGHQRWMNNPASRGPARPGAVPRAGLAALDPRTGIPLDWNPGRNPRGYGTTALELTKEGLWVGGDTKWIGNRKYRRPRIALMPAAGGHRLPGESQTNLPGTVYQLRPGRASAKAVDFTGRRVRNTRTVRLGGLRRIAKLRAGFVVGGRLVYAVQSGNLHARKFRASGLGRDRRFNPYHDPAWSKVTTGSGQTYNGRDSGLRRDLRRATNLFYRSGRLYYSMRGKRKLYWRPFSLDSGISHPRRRVAQSSIRWTKVIGAFRSGSALYFARRGSGKLLRVRFEGGAVRGRARVVAGAQRHSVRWNVRANIVYGHGLPD